VGVPQTLQAASWSVCAAAPAHHHRSVPVFRQRSPSGAALLSVSVPHHRAIRTTSHLNLLDSVAIVPPLVETRSINTWCSVFCRSLRGAASDAVTWLAVLFACLANTYVRLVGHS
jgi:hypothetical protein